jgi:trehalose 6-phosphate synthase
MATFPPRALDHGWVIPMRFTSTAAKGRYDTVVSLLPQAVVAMDLDGTLSPIVADPAAAQIHPDGPHTLIALANRVDTIAIVTGRTARQAVALARLDHVGRALTETGQEMLVFGQYGQERWSSRTRRIVSPRPPKGLARFEAEVPTLLQSLGLTDVHIETKTLGVSLHTRRSAKPVETFTALAEPVAELAALHDLIVEPGRLVIEVRAPGVDKSAAIAALVAERHPAAIMYIGDDLGDVAAFEALLELREQGLPTLLVCSGSDEERSLMEMADVIVDGPEQVIALLGVLTHMESQADFVVVANRLPVDHVELPDGSAGWRTSPGGLVTALEPVLRQHRGAWIGWAGSADSTVAPFNHDDIRLVPVQLSESEINEYYGGFCNGTIWPLYHDVVAKPEFHREWWDAYVRVNRRFAERAAQVAAQDGLVWVQDYQLQLVPQMLRELRPDLKIGFYLHIPFPPVELYLQLPWRRQLLMGLLGADLVGFQIHDDAANFVRLVRSRLGLRTSGSTVELEDGRRVRAAAYPISIDAQSFGELAAQPEVEARAKEIRQRLGDPKTVFLGIDRLDYTKGIYPRLRAFGELLASGDFAVGEAAFVQVATPSRERVDQYRLMRDEIDRLVGRINGVHGVLGFPPISYLHSSYPREEMAALYRAADIMVVTPFRDGMNLVAKEYVACRIHNDGALILSEFAGAAEELKQAWLVNPHDLNGIKEAMLEAARAPQAMLKRRMRSMRRHVEKHDVARWADSFLLDLGVS